MRDRRWLQFVAIAGIAIALAGCHSMHHRGPVPEDVALARQCVQQGLIALEQGDAAAAEQLLTRATAIRPDDIAARRGLAHACAAAGRLDDAATQLDRARRIAPQDADLAVELGDLCLAAGQLDRAFELANEALDRDPNVAGGWTLRGRVQHRAGRLDEALNDYLQALGRRPGDPMATYFAALLYVDRRQSDHALTLVQNLRESYPADRVPAQVVALENRVLGDLGRPAATGPMVAAQPRDRTVQ